ncbi:MAG: hypothetical protein BWK75_00915 [Candidatus Altiarchaeales archaeon A3]|nr:MAG: hypothetical protein BWK75_00915 [Candidatus Altiarchaeales archaeon A3]
MRYIVFYGQITFIILGLHRISLKIGGNLWIRFHQKIKKGNIFAVVFYGFLYISLTPLTVLLNFLKFG